MASLVLRTPLAPGKVRRARSVVRPRSDLNQVFVLTGKYLGAFVLFTSSMNWWYYRRTREDAEKNRKN